MSVSYFHNGKYTDEIRSVYMDLLSMNVGTANVEQVIRIFLRKLCNLNPDRLPGQIFAKNIFLETRVSNVD